MYLLNLFIFFLFMSQSAHCASGINVSKADILHICNPEILTSRDLDHYNSTPSTIIVNGKKYYIKFKLLPAKVTAAGGGFHRVRLVNESSHFMTSDIYADENNYPTVREAIHAFPEDTIAFSDEIDGICKTIPNLIIIYNESGIYVHRHEIPLNLPEKNFSFFILELENLRKAELSGSSSFSSSKLPYE